MDYSHLPFSYYGSDLKGKLTRLTTVFCNKCGAAMTDADKFCASGGPPAAAVPQALPPAVRPKTAAKPRKFLIGFVIAVAVVAVILLNLFISDTQGIDWPATLGATIGKSAVLGTMIWLMNKFICWRQG
jgi:hypothetical protein